MTRTTITDLNRITLALDITGAIETYIWEELTDGNYWHSVEDLARQLESASCANGSWGGMIYTRDIYTRLADPQWCDDIDQAIQELYDATGESPDFADLGAMVTFAVDWVASNLAHRLRSLDSVAIVTAAIDSLDPSPDVIAFADVSEAQDWVFEEVERRVQHEIDHSPYPVSEANRTAMSQVEFSLFIITEESI